MEKESDFVDIIDELNWQAMKDSDGNFEAASTFVSYRNEKRAEKNLDADNVKER